MTLLPGFYTVETMMPYSEGGCWAQIRLNPDHPVFDGHFPENPVAPGVCMLQIVKELVETTVQKSLFLVHVSSVKFTALINPHKNPVLQITFELAPQKDERIKVKSTIMFGETVAVKLTHTYKVL